MGWAGSINGAEDNFTGEVEMGTCRKVTHGRNCVMAVEWINMAQDKNKLL
jgi:hypothetical protein